MGMSEKHPESIRAPSDKLRLRLFGQIRIVQRVWADGAEHRIVEDRPSTEKIELEGYAALARLAGMPDRSADREVLATVLWPEYSSQKSRENLRRVLNRIAKLKGRVWENVGKSIRLCEQLEDDLTLFKTSFKEDRLQAVVDLHQGEFAAGLDTVAGTFEHWKSELRDRFKGQFLVSAIRLMEAFVTQGDLGRVRDLRTRVWEETAPSEIQKSDGDRLARIDAILSNAPPALHEKNLSAPTPVELPSAPRAPEPPRPRGLDRRGLSVIAALLIVAVPIALQFLHSASDAAQERILIYTADSSGKLLHARIALPDADGAPAQVISVSAAAFRAAPNELRMLPRAISPTENLIAQVLTGTKAWIELLPERPAADSGMQAGSENGNPSFSPDGNFMVFVSNRDSKSGADIRVYLVNLTTGITRALTSGESGRDDSPHWSPDGSRIAFVRHSSEGASPLLCWVTPDARRLSCSPVGAEVIDLEVRGWINPTRVVGYVQIGGRNALWIFTMDSGIVERELEPDVTQATISGDGRWVACLCSREAGVRAWWLIPTEGSRLPIELRLPGTRLEDSRVFVQGIPSKARWAAALRIDSTAGVLVGGGTRLSAYGVTAGGTRAQLGVVSWSVRDTNIAIVDSLGRLQGRGSGSTLVRAFAGGWVSDSILVSVRPPPDARQFLEEWGPSWRDRWVLFGEPKPRVELAGAAGGSPALLLDGNETFESGAYSTISWTADLGLGLEANISVPVNAGRAQRLRILIGPHWENPAAQAWDKANGAPPFLESEKRAQCSFNYPLLEGLEGRFLAGGATGGVIGRKRLPRPLGEEWHRVRLHWRSDGRCEMSLDGKNIWTSAPLIAPSGRFRVTFMGASVGTRVRVGRVRVWAGDSVPAQPPARH